MTAPPTQDDHATPADEQVDVLIVGAGLSGIAAAYYLQREHPTLSYAILEARSASGGTWDFFRYPGIRSDSDLHTFGYAFKPWTSDKAIAGAEQILAYLRETAAEHGIDGHVRFRRKVLGASWCSANARWTADVECTNSGKRTRISCGWLFCAGGYYRYDHGFTPHFDGTERFAGTIVHPQAWPDALDYAGKRVVVIGSGATAVTLVPALAERAAHVTMLQRSPSYILPIPSVDPFTTLARTILSKERAHALTRRKNIVMQRVIWTICQRWPTVARRAIRWLNARQLPAGYPVDEHFNPPYGPWDQRLCVVPDADLFKVIASGKASVVTDQIETFTETGVRLASGRELEADIVVTATGLILLPIGGLALTVDGAPVYLPDTVAFKGMMLSGVPNFALAIGYTNASWTLKVDLLCEHFCRLLAYMHEHGYTSCRAELSEPAMPTRPLLALGAGYVKRSLDILPRQGDHAPWLMSMRYQADLEMLREGPVDDPHLHFLPRAESIRETANREHPPSWTISKRSRKAS